MPSDPANRTLVLSVVAVDLVGYSRKSVAEQLFLKDGFNQLLLQAIRDISIADRIILDTGDGVAIGFLGDPEDALYVAMFMHDAINRDSAGSPSAGVGSNAIRIGINLGPVKLATGAGGHPNIIGDGINVAERIMGFAEPGQLTASRPFYEVMSRMSDHYATLFQFAGPHTDKQVRVHDVYIVGKSSAAFQHAQHGIAERAAERAGRPAKGHMALPPTPPHVAPPSLSAASPKPAVVIPAAKDISPSIRDAHVAAPIVATSARSTNALQDRFIDFLEDRNKVATTAMLLGVMVVTLAALLAYRKMVTLLPDSSAPTIATAPATAPTTSLAPATPPKVALAPVPPAVKPPTGVDRRPVPSEKTDAKAVPPAATATPAKAPPVPVPPAAKPPGVEARSVAPEKSDAKAAPPLAPAATATPAKATPAPIPAPVSPVTKPAGSDARPTTPAKTDAKAALPTTPASTAVPASVPPTAKGSLAPSAPARPETRQPSTVERTSATVGGTPASTPGARDKPKDARSEKTDKRERAGPGTTSPVVPAYQSPAEAPRPPGGAPTPAPAPRPATQPEAELVVVSRSAPQYPVEATRQSITSGFVRAKLTIDANGNVSDVEILESRPISAFGRETRTSAKQWKYNRGTAGRVQEIEITFKP